MKLKKAIFVTILVAVMLAVIDTCLYILCNPGFAVLTGAVVVYGFMRGTVDFCRWLCAPDPAPKHLAGAKKQAPADPDPKPDTTDFYDWAQDKEMGDTPGNAEAMMQVLSEDI